MIYEEFRNKIDKYIEYYETGLKKKANDYLKDFIQEFSREIEEKEQIEIIYQLCMEICDDKEKHALLRRGDGNLPYELYKYLREKLYKECQENKMPQLRWFYQLFRNDREYYDEAIDMLYKAYNHDMCDDKTVLLYLDYWINILGFGAHHFPEGCCISDECYQEAIEKCNQVIKEKKVSSEQLENLEYYKRLYAGWEKYLADNRKNEFEYYCME